MVLGGRRDVIDPRGIQRCFLSSLLRGHDPAAIYDAGSTSSLACLARLLLADDAFLSVVGTATQEVKLRDRAVFVTALFTLPFYPPQIPTLHSAHAEPAQCACAPDCLVLYVAFSLRYLALSDALSASRCFLKDRMTLHWAEARGSLITPLRPSPLPGLHECQDARGLSTRRHSNRSIDLKLLPRPSRLRVPPVPVRTPYVVLQYPRVPTLFSQSPHERAPIHL